MAARFLSTGAGSFQGPARIVQPYVAAGHHLARDVHVIIFDKHDIALELAKFAQVNDMLDELFPLIIARVGFAGVNELDRPLTVVDEPDDLFVFLENDRRAFVSCEATRTTDG